MNTVAGTEDTAVNKTWKVSASMQLAFFICVYNALQTFKLFFPMPKHPPKQSVSAPPGPRHTDWCVIRMVLPSSPSGIPLTIPEWHSNAPMKSSHAFGCVLCPDPCSGVTALWAPQRHGWAPFPGISSMALWVHIGPPSARPREHNSP